MSIADLVKGEVRVMPKSVDMPRRCVKLRNFMPLGKDGARCYLVTVSGRYAGVESVCTAGTWLKLPKSKRKM